MDCHESLMQRRRKKKAVAQAKRPGTANVKLDKSLPSLPPSMEDARSIDETPSETGGYVEAAAEVVPGRKDSVADSTRSDNVAQGNYVLSLLFFDRSTNTNIPRRSHTSF